VDELLTIAVRHVSEVFRSQVVVLLPGADRGLTPWSGGQFQLDTNEQGVARWSTSTVSPPAWAPRRCPAPRRSTCR